MSNLEEFYASIGSDATEVIRRLGGNPTLIFRFLPMFLSDTSYNELCTALDSNNTEAAFRAAHKLKGVSGTLGFQKLFELASSVTELLRGGALKEAQAAKPALDLEYEKVLEGLKGLNLSAN